MNTKDDDDSGPIVVSMIDEERISKLLECPVCYEIIYAPVIGCLSGHNICGICRQSLQECPICRKGYSGVRNLFAEQFLERCVVKCRYRSCGCREEIAGQDLTYHYTVCDYRPIICRQCDEEVPYGDFIEHMKIKENLDTQLTNECSTGFEIIEMDLKYKGRVSVWEPTWLHCYNHDFFCFLNFDGKFWWIWVALLGLEESCSQFKCHMVLWNKEKGTELKYVGTVHPIRTPPEEVLQGGECLVLSKMALNNYLFKNGIDVLVGVDKEYHPPTTRTGNNVTSPVAIVDQKLQNVVEEYSSSEVNDVDDEDEEEDFVPVEPVVESRVASEGNISSRRVASSSSMTRTKSAHAHCRPSRRCSMIID